MSAPPVVKRSWAERVVLWGVFLTALWNLGRAGVLISQMEWLAELNATPDPRLRAALAIVWAILLFVVAFGLARRLSWSRLLIPLLLALYGVNELVMIIAFAATPPALLPFLAYAVFVGFAGWVLWRPAGGLSSISRNKGGR